MKLSKTLALIVAFTLCSTPMLSGKLFNLDFVGKKADKMEEKRVDKEIVEKKFWSKTEASSLQGKTFPITKWNKHFSSLGSKRAPIATGEKGKKERFDYKVIDRKEVDLEMSRWNDRMSDLHKQASIQMDDKARIASDHQFYDMMLQDTRHYKELAEKLSLRDINRYQFRRNREDGEISTQKAGSQEKE